MTTNYCIYGLFDPITNELIYIGFSQNVINRVYNHRSMHHKNIEFESNPYKYIWVESLRSLGQQPTFEVLFYCSNYREAKEKELELIIKYRAEGNPLINRVPRLGDKQFLNILNKSKWIKERNISI